MDAPQAGARLELVEQLSVAPPPPAHHHEIDLVVSVRPQVVEGREQGEQVLARLDGPDGQNVGARQAVLGAHGRDRLFGHRSARRVRGSGQQHHPFGGDAEPLDDVAPGRLRHGGDRRRANHRATEQRARHGPLAPGEQLGRPVDRQIVHEGNRRTRRGQRHDVVRERRHVGSAVGQHARGVGLQPDGANAGPPDLQVGSPSLGQLSGRLAIRDQHQLVTGRTGLQQAVDQVLCVVANSRAQGGAGGDLDG